MIIIPKVCAVEIFTVYIFELGASHNHSGFAYRLSLLIDLMTFINLQITPISVVVNAERFFNDIVIRKKKLKNIVISLWFRDGKLGSFYYYYY